MEASLVQSADEMAKELYDIEVELETLDNRMKLLNERKRGILPAIGQFIVQNNMKSFPSNYGLIYSENRFTVAFPTALEHKRELQRYYGEEVYLSHSSIHHQKFTSMAKTRFEECMEKGILFDYPFVTPTIETTYKFRRNKKQ